MNITTLLVILLVVLLVGGGGFLRTGTLVVVRETPAVAQEALRRWTTLLVRWLSAGYHFFQRPCSNSPEIDNGGCHGLEPC